MIVCQYDRNSTLSGARIAYVIRLHHFQPVRNRHHQNDQHRFQPIPPQPSPLSPMVGIRASASILRPTASRLVGRCPSNAAVNPIVSLKSPGCRSTAYPTPGSCPVHPTVLLRLSRSSTPPARRNNTI